MKRMLLALAATWGLLIAAPGIALGHAQLISSAPGSSQVMAKAPGEVRLAFSEPIESEYSAFSLSDGEGKILATNLGDPDPEDPYALVATMDEFPTGGYSVSWQALSAADGHTTNGFYTFAIGQGLAGETHNLAGHGVDAAGKDHAAPPLIAAPIELAGRAISYLGLLTAFGLLPIAWFVLRPSYGTMPRRVGIGMALSMAVASIGALILSFAVANNAQLDVPTYLTSSRTGLLLFWRVVVSIVATLAVIGLLRFVGPTVAVFAGAGGAAAGLVLLAMSGHASAFASPGPFAAMLVHLFSGAVWLAGIVALVVLALRRDRPPMSVLVPRFSALALLSIALLAATGLYADWVQTRDPISIASDYQLTLAAKIVVVLAALALGALNFLDAGRGRGWLGGFRTRIVAEVTLAAMILLVTANLGSGFPPASQRPIPIQETVSSAVVEGQARRLNLDIGPGRPGLNRVIVTVDPAPPEFTRVTVDLVNRVSGSGVNTLFLKLAGDDPTKRIFFLDGGLLPPNTTWDVTVAATNPDGLELAHGRFEFSLDRTGIVSGRKVPPIDPGLALGFLLLCASVLGGVYALGGGSLPGVHAATGRVALAGGGVVGSAIGLILVVFGGRL